MADDMITYVFSRRGQRISKKAVYIALVACWPNDPYANEKASGSIGGALAHKYIKEINNYYECTRNPI